jgi:hypothetical protein
MGGPKMFKGVNSMFTDSEDREIWKKKGFGDYKYLHP